MNSTLPSYYTHPYGGYRFDNCARFYSQTSPTDEMFDDDNQIPTVQEFNAIINDYLTNLSPKKRDKALVDQYRYSQIQQVLRDPRNTAISTAQFRFWVKKMFQLQPGTTEMVCHDNKPVATKEQIYEILVRAHREAHHGGRDKTSALVRRRYSWIPKELVARFVRHCPFCINRRSSGQSPLTKSTSPSRFPRHSYSLDSSNPPICTPSLKEESDLSSDTPSSMGGYDTLGNYGCMSTNSSPRKPYFNSLYGREEQELLDCTYNTSLQSNPFNTIVGFNDCQQSPLPGSINPLMHSSNPHSALFYAQNPVGHNDYSDYPFYNTGYYPNSLGITTCHENSSSPSSNAAAVAVAAAAVFMRPSTTSPVDLLSHHQDHYNSLASSDTTNSNMQSPNCSTPTSSHFLSYTSMPENSF